MQTRGPPSGKKGHWQGDAEAIQVDSFHGETGNIKVAQLPVTFVKLGCQQPNQPALSV